MTNKLYFTALIVLAVMFTANIFLYTKLLSFSNQIKTIEEKTIKLQLENSLFEKKVYKKSSLKVIEEKAKLLGLEDKQELVILSDPKIALSN
ncbi:MAG: hypothetical protein KatS3mg091_488 [Patescibacteria group bacterium]|nr:MAG: hypothetical protein KatS3mg091_488 [Patescibacteria group bacterium]